MSACVNSSPRLASALSWLQRAASALLPEFVDGCGLAASNLFDTDGLIGVATQSLSIRPRE